MKILVAISDQQMGESVLEHLKRTPARNDVEIHFVHVVQWLPNKKEKESWPGLTEFAEAKWDEASQLLDRMAKEFRKTNPNCDIRQQVLHGHPGEEILRYVQQHKIDETVVAPHQRNELSKFFCGNVSAELMQHLPCTLTIVKTTK